MADSPSRDWRIDVLRSLGAPVTRANLAFLAAWQRQEGGHTNNDAHFNWLNSTNGKQFPTINGVGVRSYPNYSTGIQQTVSTLNNGRYRYIVAGLRLGNPTDKALVPYIGGDLQTWVSGRRNGNPQYANRVFQATAQRNPGSGGIGGALHEGWNFIDPTDPKNLLLGPETRAGLFGVQQTAGLAEHIPVVGGAIGAVGDVAHAATSIPDALGEIVGGFRWVFGNWDRMLLVFGGFILLIIGLVMMGRAAGRSEVVSSGPVGSVANRLQYGPMKELTRARRGVPRRRVTPTGMERRTPTRSGYNPAEADVPF